MTTFSPEQILATLNRHNVRYVVIGSTSPPSLLDCPASRTGTRERPTSSWTA
jgi:hypothetical protein